MKKYPSHISLKKPNGDYKTEAELEREASLPPPKKYYDVKLEVNLPATIHYRILASSPDEAVQMISRSVPTSVKYSLPRRRDLKAIVYDAGTTLIRFTKIFHRN